MMGMGSSSAFARSRCHWHWWHPRQCMPLRQPPLRLAYLQAAPQIFGCPTEPMEITISLFWPSAEYGAGGGGHSETRSPTSVSVAPAPLSSPGGYGKSEETSTLEGQPAVAVLSGRADPGASLTTFSSIMSKPVCCPLCRKSSFVRSSSAISSTGTDMYAPATFCGVSSPFDKPSLSLSEIHVKYIGSGVRWPLAWTSWPNGARLGGTLRATATMLPFCACLCHTHRWQRTHEDPSLHPDALLLYLQAGPQA
mmetsp:Transcript_42057/g.131065  ORF Transcript_42057/g.131065 Transcript_42057/m.131065 type:complete len:252 (+) Transcript_42057:93-848(+)